MHDCLKAGPVALLDAGEELLDLAQSGMVLQHQGRPGENGAAILAAPRGGTPTATAARAVGC
jgi:hypothetical protein